MNETRSAMLDLILGATKAHVNYCVAQLDIVDYLSEEPMTAEELAVITSTNNEMLYRLLRAAVSTGLLTENDQNQFSVTALGSTLKTGGEQSMKYLSIMLLNDGLIPRPVSKLLKALKHGETYVDNGLLFFEKTETEFPLTTNLHETLKEFNQLSFADLLISEYDYSKFKHIIDVGGGLGTCLIDILKKTPECRGTVVDLSSVVEMAKSNIERSSVKERCKAVAGDFFTSVPDDGDCYILRFILHDWCDELALQILMNVRKNMKNDATLMVMERMKEGTDPNILDLFDIQMFSVVSGKERSKLQFEKLFKRASFKLNQVLYFNPSPLRIIEVQPI